VDTDEAALDLSSRVVKRMVGETGADLVCEASTERGEVLSGSDFVLNSISVGEPWAREKDVEIGERYGIYQPTSQTVGPAGYVRGLRVIPHAVDIARDIAHYCPDAIVLNLANPLAAVCRSMVREAGVEVIGLCEQWAVTLPVFGQLLGVEAYELDCVSVGTNHLTFAKALHHGGKDVLPEFLSRLETEAGQALLEEMPVSREIYEAFGLWPTGTEAHIAEFFPYFLTPETRGGQDYGLETRHVTEEQIAERKQERASWADGSGSIDGLLGPSGESVVELIAALLGMEEADVHMVNVPNGGVIDGLPEQTFVELPTHIGPGGARGLKVGALLQPVSQVLSTRAAQQEVQIDAALSGDRATALKGLLMDAQIVSLKAAHEILDASLEANAEWLPRFHQTQV
jgi:alpha-galactosidase